MPAWTCALALRPVPHSGFASPREPECPGDGRGAGREAWGAAPHIPPHTHTPPWCGGRERAGCRGHGFCHPLSALWRLLSFTTIPQPSPTPQKPIKAPGQAQVPTPSFAVIFCISISVNPFVRAFDSVSTIPPSEKHLLNIGPDASQGDSLAVITHKIYLAPQTHRQWILKAL